MFLAEPMSEMTIVFLEKDEPVILETITDSGMVHVLHPQSIHPWTKEMKEGNIQQDERHYASVATKARSLLKELSSHSSRKLPVENTRLEDGGSLRSVESAEQLQNQLTKISEPGRKIQSQLQTLETERNQLQIIEQQLHSPQGLEMARRFKGPHSFLRVEFLKGREENIPTLQSRLEKVPSVVMPISSDGDGQATVMTVVLRRDRGVLDRAMQSVGFEIQDPAELQPKRATSLEKVQARKTEIEGQVQQQKEKLTEWAKENVSDISRIYTVAKRGELLSRARSFIRSTKHSKLISGWIPSRNVKNLGNELKHRTEERCFIQATPAKELNEVRTGKALVPAFFKNPNWMRPFEPLTKGFGIPKYESVNPTPFLAVSFLFMFGMMFGDVGHGAVLAIAGFVMMKKKTELIGIGKILLMGGISSILFGFLYGSIFGLEHILHPLWIQPMEQIEYLAIIALIFGVMMLTVGIILKVINSYREHNWADLIFDKSGLVGGLLYWLILGFATRTLWLAGSRIHTLLLGIIGLLMLGIVFKEPLLRIFRIPYHEEGSTNIFGQIFDGVFELYETLMAYLSNTVSFVRLAAFALGHVGVSMGIYSLMDVIQTGPASVVWKILLVVLGNAGVILLEGLVVGIQTVRLEYYEFFCKFFGTGGLEYKPLNLEEE